MIETLIVTGLIAVGYALLFIRMSILERRINRIARLEAKVDALLEASGIDPFENLPTPVREAIERGEIAVAVKRFRQATGAGMKESKDFIEEARRRKATAG